MTVFQFTYQSSGKYAVVPSDDIVGISYIYNTEAEMLRHVNTTNSYQIAKNPSGNFILTGRAGLNYLSSITQSGNIITAIGWSTSLNSALSTPNINSAISIATAISANF